MNQDGVAEAFDLILDEITIVENELIGEGAAAMKEKRFEMARTVIEGGERLQAFRAKLEDLKREWAKIDLKTRRRVQVSPTSAKAGKKASRTRLRVTLHTGKVIQQATAAETFADVIAALGVDTIRKLGLIVNGIPLVGDKKHPKYNQLARERSLIVTHSSTRAKKDLLEAIADKLSQRIRVEVVP
jgi:hypothetical protein